jgi:hypothetical protein
VALVGERAGISHVGDGVATLQLRASRCQSQRKTIGGRGHPDLSLELPNEAIGRSALPCRYGANVEVLARNQVRQRGTSRRQRMIFRPLIARSERVEHLVWQGCPRMTDAVRPRNAAHRRMIGRYVEMADDRASATIRGMWHAPWDDDNIAGDSAELSKRRYVRAPSFGDGGDLNIRVNVTRERGRLCRGEVAQLNRRATCPRAVCPRSRHPQCIRHITRDVRGAAAALVSVGCSRRALMSVLWHKCDLPMGSEIVRSPGWKRPSHARLIQAT